MDNRSKAVPTANQGEGSGRPPVPRVVEAPMMESLVRRCEELRPSVAAALGTESLAQSDGRVFTSYVPASEVESPFGIRPTGQGIPGYCPPGQFMNRTVTSRSGVPVYTRPPIPTQMTCTGSQNNTWISPSGYIATGQIPNGTTPVRAAPYFQQVRRPWFFGYIPGLYLLQRNVGYQLPYLPPYGFGIHPVRRYTPSVMVKQEPVSFPPTGASGGVYGNPTHNQKHVKMLPHPSLMPQVEEDIGRVFVRRVRQALGRYSSKFMRLVDLMLEYNTARVSLHDLVTECIYLLGGDPFLVGEFKKFLPAVYQDMDLTVENLSAINGEVASAPPAYPSGVTDDALVDIKPIVPAPDVIRAGGHQGTSSDKIAVIPESNAVVTQGDNVDEEYNEMIAVGTATIRAIDERSRSYAKLFANINEDSFVDRVKERFNETKYAQFMYIVGDYKTKAKAAANTGMPISLIYETETLSTIQILFKDDQDLLKEYYRHLPFVDSETGEIIPTDYSLTNRNVAESFDGFISESINSLNKKSQDQAMPNLKEQSKLETRNSVLSRLRPRPNKDESLKVKVEPENENVNLLETKVQPGPSRCDPPAPKMLNLANAFKSYKKVDKGLLTRDIKQRLRSPTEQYRRFFCALDLYDFELISDSEMIDIGKEILVKYPNLFERLKSYIGQVERLKKEGNPNAVEAYKRGVSQEDKDLKRKRVGASYYMATDQYCVSLMPRGPFLGTKGVLNDGAFKSKPIWSGKRKIHSKKKSAKSDLDKTEDCKSDLDTKINRVRSTIVCLKVVQRQMEGMTPEERAEFQLDDNLGGTSIVHQGLIKRFYGDHGQTIIHSLKSEPEMAIPVVLNRLTDSLNEALSEKLDCDKELWWKYPEYYEAMKGSKKQQDKLCQVAAKNKLNLDPLISNDPE